MTDSPTPDSRTPASPKPASPTPDENGHPSTEKARELLVTPPKSLSQWLEALLKSPWVFFELSRERRLRVVPMFGLLTFTSLCGYGALMGTFEDPLQCYVPALKVATGMLLTALLCFPSLYIFVCLTGVDLKLGQALGLLTSAIALTAILLIGFGPVAFVFSVSVQSYFFMGVIHVCVWFVSLLFALRFLERGLTGLGVKSVGYIRFWGLILLVTTLQMSTTLRPLLGTAEETVQTEKRFFVEHWALCLQHDIGRSDKDG
ncbi:MAG: hypothetical protein AAF581_14870 [Planctomycetota bacterium]